MTDLPIINDGQAFAAWRADPLRWRGVVQDIAASEHISANVLTPFGTGTNLVIDLDGRLVLKLFPPFHRRQFTVERASLGLLQGQLASPIPQVVGEGELQGWPYLLMTRLDGIVGSAAWPTLSEDDKESVLHQIGAAIAQVQAVSPGELATMEPTWPEFVAQQVAGCVQRHRRPGLSENLLADLADLIQQVPDVVPLDVEPVILTGEWIPENFLLTEAEGQWQLAAVIDFGDVITGWREYDLLGPSTFMCEGLPSRIRSFLRGYGMAPADMDDALRRRLLLRQPFTGRAISGMFKSRSGRLGSTSSPTWKT